MQAAIVHQKVEREKKNSSSQSNIITLRGEVNYISNLNSLSTDFSTAERLFEDAMKKYYDGWQGGTFWGVESLYIDGNSLNWGFIGTYNNAFKPYPPDMDTDEPFIDEQEQSVENSPYYDDVTCNLITKRYCYEKPTYENLQLALDSMKEFLERELENKKTLQVGMPLIGCGIDGLEWDKVSKMVKDTFADLEGLDVLVVKYDKERNTPRKDRNIERE